MMVLPSISLVPCRSISALIGIPDAAMLELTYPLSQIPSVRECGHTENITFNLARCRPSWSEHVDFGVLLVKVGTGLLVTVPEQSGDSKGELY